MIIQAENQGKGFYYATGFSPSDAIIIFEVACATPAQHVPNGTGGGDHRACCCRQGFAGNGHPVFTINDRLLC